jgi:SAM-dependent methyltransferase
MLDRHDDHRKGKTSFPEDLGREYACRVPYFVPLFPKEKKVGVLHRLARWVYTRRGGSVFNAIDVIDTNRSTIRKFVEAAAFNTKEGQRVLDAGAGEGNWRYLFPHANYITQDKCIGDAGWNYSNIDYNCDITSIPLGEASVDVVLLIEVLEHLPEPLSALKELNRILKKGGYLYVTVPQGWAEHQVPHDYYRFTQYGLLYLLQKAHFQVKTIEKRGGYFKYIAFRMWHLLFMPFLNRETLVKKMTGWLVKIGLVFFLLPASIVCYLVDNIFDKEKELTLGYQLVAVKE